MSNVEEQAGVRVGEVNVSVPEESDEKVMSFQIATPQCNYSADRLLMILLTPDTRFARVKLFQDVRNWPIASSRSRFHANGAVLPSLPPLPASGGRERPNVTHRYRP